MDLIPTTPQHTPQWVAWIERWRGWLLAVGVVLITAILLYALHRLTRNFDYAGLHAAMAAVPVERLVLAGVMTLVSYAAITGYDHTGLRYVGHPLPYRIVGQTSFVASALGNSIGLGMLTGGAVRLRMYTAAGVEAANVAKVIAFVSAGFGSGLMVTGAAAVLYAGGTVAPALRMPAWPLQALALAVLVFAGWLWWRCGRTEEPVRLFGRLDLRLPGRRVALAQVGLAIADIVFAAATLWLLLPAGVVAFPIFAAYFAIALLLGVISHMPGGVGVFEAVILLGLRGTVPAETLASALLLYRGIYFGLPMALALVWLVVVEARVGRIGRTTAPLRRAAVGLAPTLLAAFTLLSGVMLLVSGVTPAQQEALAVLAQHVPLPLTEAAHFLGSLAGVAMIVVSRGMLKRLDAAWWAGLLLALVSMVLALPKGIALSEGGVLALLSLALIVSRRQFDRPASLFAEPFTAGWLWAVAGIIVLSAGILFFSYREVAYTNRLWWQLEFDAEAPRSLRAMLGVSVVALTFFLSQLLRPRRPALAAPGPAELDRAEGIVRSQDTAEAWLALSGDKYLMFSASGKAFLMYGRRGRSWIALFDPVGPKEDRAELVWAFLEKAREAGGRPAFYQVRADDLPTYLDAGLRVLKLGEQAYIPLADFSLKGGRRANLRSGVNRAEREGLSFEVLRGADIGTAISELREVSNAWLAAHNTAEKGFSLGSFDSAYLRRKQVAVARRDGRIVAFATLMASGQGREASVDLMRHRPDAPPGTMDYLFVKVILYFQAEGCERFSLGMAPLSGMAQHELASRWHRMGRLLYAHGEHFYNFQGLRSFKEKFDPVWEPRYLAAPGGVAPLLALADTAVLISGGLRGMLLK